MKLIRVHNAICPDNSGPVEKYLNETYAPAVVKWHVSIGETITRQELPDLNFENFQTGNNRMLSSYTREMSRVYNYYKRTHGTDKNTLYLFFIDYPNPDKEGFMFVST